MVKNYGYVSLKDFNSATEESKKEFSKIFNETDYLRGGSPYYAHIINLLNPEKNRKILDVGYGRGFFLKSIEEKELKLYGIDFCDGAIESASKIIKNAKLFTGDIHQTNFKDKEFDYITCLGVIEHLIEPSKGVKEIVRILKDDGTVIFTIPNSYYASINLTKQKIFYNVAKLLNSLRLRKKKAVHFRQPIDRFYTPKEGKLLLENNGLEVINVELLKSKRENFRIIKSYKNNKINPTMGYLSSNFVLYKCKKS